MNHFSATPLTYRLPSRGARRRRPAFRISVDGRTDVCSLPEAGADLGGPGMPPAATSGKVAPPLAPRPPNHGGAVTRPRSPGALPNFPLFAPQRAETGIRKFPFISSLLSPQPGGVCRCEHLNAARASHAASRICFGRPTPK